MELEYVLLVMGDTKGKKRRETRALSREIKMPIDANEYVLLDIYEYCAYIIPKEKPVNMLMLRSVVTP